MNRVLVAFAALVAVAMPALSSARSSADVRWRTLVHVPGAVDVVGPRKDGRLVVAASQGLWLLRRNGTLTRFARAYTPAPGEAYITLAADRRLRSRGCSFHRDDVFALDPATNPGVIRIDRRGRVSRLADFPAKPFLAGITFDRVGRFGSRLLVTAISAGKTTLYAIDCRGRVAAVSEGGPAVEGGIAVAPLAFGRFGGRLVAVSEVSGGVYAFRAGAAAELIAPSGLVTGGDIGVESIGFVPRGFGRRGAAYMADTGGQLAAPTHGTDSVLRASGRDLVAAGVRSGDLLVATEAGGVTARVRCRRTCTVRRIGQALAETHGEGHISFALRG